MGTDIALTAPHFSHPHISSRGQRFGQVDCLDRASIAYRCISLLNRTWHTVAIVVIQFPPLPSRLLPAASSPLSCLPKDAKRLVKFTDARINKKYGVEGSGPTCGN